MRRQNPGYSPPERSTRRLSTHGYYRPTVLSTYPPVDDFDLRFLYKVNKSKPGGDRLWEAATTQMADAWLGGPQPFTCEGDLFVNGGDVQKDPACRFGAQQGRKLGASDCLRTSDANSATAIRAPGDLPLWATVLEQPMYLEKLGRPGNPIWSGTYFEKLGQPMYLEKLEHPAPRVPYLVRAA